MFKRAKYQSKITKFKINFSKKFSQRFSGGYSGYFSKGGFSLIELSVVILVIGILIAGVSQGYGVIRSAQINNARSITTKSPVAQIPDLLAWYETSLKESLLQSQIRNGAQTTEWRDISPSSLLLGNNKLTVTASNNITYLSSGINKLPSLRFTGSSRLTIANFSQGSFGQATIFLVFSPNYTTDTTNYRTILDGNASNFSISIRQNNVQLNAGTAVATGTVASSFLINRNYILCAYFNTTSSQVFVNNANANFGGGSGINPGTNSLSGLVIGATRTGTLGFGGSISEVIIFNRVLKVGERREIFNYLAKKYKIEVVGT